ncbi:MAG: TRAP transporter substrate-binding protein [Clostridia bacterium]|nr:TRAP transporter substrate-binding protein [Clostridia bacterium]
MKRNVKIIAVLLMVMMLVSVTGCSKQQPAPGAPAEKKEVFQFKLAHFWAANSPIETQFVQLWIKAVEEATDGQIIIKSYPGETLLTANEMYDGVVNGIADMGISFFSYSRGRFPVVETIELPGIVFHTAKSGSRSAWDLINELNPAEVKDTQLLMVATTGPAYLTTQKPVRNLADIKGMEIRTTGASAKGIDALGGVAVALSMGESYEALSRGVVKGILGPCDIYDTWKLGEVTDYVTVSPFIYNSLFYLTMNKDKFEGMPADLQAKFKEVNAKVYEDILSGLYDRLNGAALEGALQRGELEKIELDPAEIEKWMAKFEVTQNAYVADLESKGLPGLKALDRIKELAEKYNAIE